MRRQHHVTAGFKPIEELEGWEYTEDKGEIVHLHDHFFAIRGACVEIGEKCIDQPIIYQPEVGILGLLVRNNNGKMEILVQAKAEPGNAGITQFAPTFQATPSNYFAVHGGAAQPYSSIFLQSRRYRRLFDTLQSEQGTRFYYKRNRNIAIEMPYQPDFETASGYRWMNLDAVKEIAGLDNTVNTDLRSLLACLPGAGVHTSRRIHPWITDEAVQDILLSETGPRDAAEALHYLETWQTGKPISSSFVPLSKLPNWQINKGNIEPKNGAGNFAIRGISVEADCREVSTWSQPIVDTYLPDHLWQVCRIRDGRLQLLIRAVQEPCVAGLSEFSVTMKSKGGDLSAEPAHRELIDMWPPLLEHFQTSQTEEGGRFYQDVNVYHLLELPDRNDVAVPEDCIWISLNGLHYLTLQGNILTSELRSMVSFL